MRHIFKVGNRNEMYLANINVNDNISSAFCFECKDIVLYNICKEHYRWYQMNAAVILCNGCFEKLSTNKKYYRNIYDSKKLKHNVHMVKNVYFTCKKCANHFFIEYNPPLLEFLKRRKLLDNYSFTMI